MTRTRNINVKLITYKKVDSKFAIIGTLVQIIDFIALPSQRYSNRDRALAWTISSIAINTQFLTILTRGLNEASKEYWRTQRRDYEYKRVSKKFKNWMFTLRKPFKEIIYEGENELELLSRTLPEHHHGGNDGYAESNSRPTSTSFFQSSFFDYSPHLLPIIFITLPNANAFAHHQSLSDGHGNQSVLIRQ